MHIFPDTKLPPHEAKIQKIHLFFSAPQELSRSILSVQYLGALRRAAEKAAENARQKVFLVPPGGVEIGTVSHSFLKINMVNYVLFCY